ncbi:MAG: hypothetical protein QOC93_2847 [Actinomycetota bacterium]|jgi:hypothetical protein|nr:hypothetical protein [Cryptosporangiaceae bacterium]MDQ1677703.1 hypothetical protein [Actinomycetota bacterium]
MSGEERVTPPPTPPGPPPGESLLAGPASPERNPLTPPQGPRWIAPLFAGLGVLTLPWIVFLAFTLPHRATAHHYRLAWVGFDVVLMLALLSTAFLAWRGRRLVIVPAVVTATLLLVDAWFDVLTSGGKQLLFSGALAVFVELPLAAVCVWIAGHTVELSMRREAYLARRLARTE